MELKEAREEIARKDAEISLAQDQSRDLKEMQDLLEGWDTGSGKLRRNFLLLMKPALYCLRFCSSICIASIDEKLYWSPGDDFALTSDLAMPAQPFSFLVSQHLGIINQLIAKC